MVAYSTKRTEVPYPTYGPADTGESWHDYFIRIRSADAETERDDHDDNVRLRRIVSSGKGLGSLEPKPNSALGYHRNLEAAGFETRVDWTSWVETGGVYGDSAQKAGQPYPDVEGVTLIIQAYKPGRLLKLGYELKNGKWTCIWRQINRQYTLPSDKEVKAWINEESD